MYLRQATQPDVSFQLVGEDVAAKDLNCALEELMSEFDVNKDGRLELEELSHLMSVEDNFMKAFCVSETLNSIRIT